MAGLEADKCVDCRALTLPRHKEAVQLKGAMVREITLSQDLSTNFTCKTSFAKFLVL